jgi:hypothetical protein
MIRLNRHPMRALILSLASVLVLAVSPASADSLPSSELFCSLTDPGICTTVTPYFSTTALSATWSVQLPAWCCGARFSEDRRALSAYCPLIDLTSGQSLRSLRGFRALLRPAAPARPWGRGFRVAG